MSKIGDLKARVVTLLTADAYFTDPDPTKVIPVLAQIAGDIANKIQQQMQKLGVGVFVFLRQADFPDNDSPQITLQPQLAVIVTENVIINKTGKTADEITEKILPLVHWKEGVVGDETRIGRLKIDRRAIRSIPPPPQNPSLISYDISVNAYADLN